MILLGILASFAAVSEAWPVAMMLTQGSLILAVLIVLLSTRYVVRLLRTQERKSRIAAERMTKLVEENARRERESYIDLRRLHASTQSTIGEAIAKASTDTHEITQDSASEMKRKLEELDSTMQKSERTQSRHVTSTVRDSTRQVESLIQIYTRFKDLKLPMPSTGGFAIDSQALGHLLALVEERRPNKILDRKSTRLNSSHVSISYAVFC